ncbi:MAG: folate family ECF transporter S component [Ruminococcaceae bacterium]|nr:folate family ECF transporter S component [Oscillospiraceae bacterium]
MKYNRKALFALTLTAAMTALSVVFCRFLGYAPEGTPFRFDLGFLPIALVGYMLGPVYAALGYAVADIIGSLLNGYAPNPWILLCQIAFALIMGVFFYKKNITLKRVILCFLLGAVLVDFLLKSPVLVYMYSWTWSFTLWSRAINALINLPIRIISFYFIYSALKKPMDRFL